MLLETKQLISNSTTYGIGNILVKIVTFLLIPLYARKLLPTEYGVVAILELVELIGKTVCTYGLAQSILRFFINHKNENKESQLIFSSYIFIFIINFILLGTLFIFPDKIVGNLLSLNANNITYFRYIIVVIFLMGFQTLFISILQAEEKALYYICFMLFTFILTIGLNIYQVGILNNGIMGIVTTKFYVAILNFIIINIYLFRRFKVKFSFAILKNNLNYGLPLIFVGVSLNILSLADRYLLKTLRDISEVGIYAMVYKFGMIINMVLITPFKQAFFPLMFRLYEQQDIKKLYRKYLTYFNFIGFILFLALSMFAREILTIVTTPEYAKSYFIVPMIAFSYLLFGNRFIFTNVLASLKKTNFIAYSTIFGAILHIGLNLFFIPKWGIIGASIASILSFFLITLVTFIPQQKLYYISWDWSRLFKIMITALLIYSITLFVNFHSIYLILIIKLFLFMLFPILLYKMNFFLKSELDTMTNIFKRFLKPGKEQKRNQIFNSQEDIQ